MVRMIVQMCVNCRREFAVPKSGRQYCSEVCRAAAKQRQRKRRERSMSTLEVEQYLSAAVERETAPAWERVQR